MAGTNKRGTRKASAQDKELARITSRTAFRLFNNRRALNDERRARHQAAALISRLEEGCRLCAAGTPPSAQEFREAALAAYRSASPAMRETFTRRLWAESHA